MGEIAEKLRILDSEVKSLNTANSTKTQDLTQKYESFMIAGNEQKEEIINEMTKINQYIN